ncbi:MAG TPA: hypothetical protein VHU83_16535 [Bryobacteraceae bacterium]|jgi:hypothetical protein|nr:hypothetical protein [Bryobacteraceae bacterium]
MRRAFLLVLALAAITWLEFEIFPGHSYLHADTQLLLPILERLDSPGFLSRDLVATHPHLTYTIYDEATLFLREAGRLDFKAALFAQQLLYRLAAVLGVFLLARAARLRDASALLISALVNLGAMLPGPAVFVTDPEATPRAFAFGLVLLAMGLLAREKPLLAGLAGGLALLYHVPTAAPLWAVALLAFIFERRLRSLLRPALSILAVFVLLLANLAQLQPGVIEPQPLFAKISNQLAALQQFRVSYVWVSLWAGREIWIYLAVWVCAVWATTRIWPWLNLQLRWFFVALPLCGILSVPLSDLLLEHLRWSLVPALQPARTLVYTVAIASLVCGVAGIRAAANRRPREAAWWFALVLLAPLSEMASITIPSRSTEAAVAQMAGWADRNTWGSSMFLFPDAQRALYPGIFRAESRRAVWVDWTSGAQMKYFESVGQEWWDRWRATMAPQFSSQRLPPMLSLPIDYFVLKRANQLANVRPVFANREFVVYDAADLRSAPALR